MSSVSRVMPRFARVAPALRALALVCAVSATGSALAQTAADLQAQAQQWVDASLARLSVEQGLRMHATLGSLDSRLKLAPCGNVEPYLPHGARLWGRSRVGLRCVDGMSRWNVTLPVVVQALGPAWVLQNPVAQGGTVQQSDVRQAEVDWAQETAAVLKDPSAWLGQVANRNLQAGQVLRQGMVRAVQVFQAGTQVRVVAQGRGFQISSEAQALTAGVVGEVARVRTEGGRVAMGVVLDARTVKIDL